MSRIDLNMPTRLWYEEMNRIRQEIQKRWTQAQRSYRRQVALCRQQELARLLRLVPDARTSQRPTSTDGQNPESPSETSPRAARRQNDARDARRRRTAASNA